MLKAIIKPLKQSIIDNEFGILHFVEDFDGNSFWSGKTQFKNIEVDIHFQTSTDSPTTSQRGFLKRIEIGYEELVSNIYRVLPKKLKENSRLAESGYFVELFKPKAILIAKDFENSTWSLTLQSTENNQQFLCVEFKGFHPQKSFLEK